jgi:small conductance mechanosensitive channel
VEAGGDEGIIQEVGVFATTMNTRDNVSIIIPNSAIWGGKIRNYTSNPVRRIDIPIGISYRDDIEKAKGIIRQVLSDEPRILKDREIVVAVTGLGDSSVDLLVAPWCKPEDYLATRWDLIQKIKEQLEANGCNIPFPQRDVHLYQS